MTKWTIKMKFVTITPSPTNDGIEVVDLLLVMKRHGPYTMESVVIQFSPNIVGHEPEADQPGTKIRQQTITTNTDETIEHTFDLNATKIHSIQANGASFDVELLKIDSVGPFPSYSFGVTRTS
jgi:hypothetical protein